jgi:hypothetical protein
LLYIGVSTEKKIKKKNKIKFYFRASILTIDSEVAHPNSSESLNLLSKSASRSFLKGRSYRLDIGPVVFFPFEAVFVVNLGGYYGAGTRTILHERERESERQGVDDIGTSVRTRKVAESEPELFGVVINQLL